MQYSYFSLYSVFPPKNVHPFRNIVQFLPTPTLYKVESGKKNSRSVPDTRVQLFFVG